MKILVIAATLPEVLPLVTTLHPDNTSISSDYIPNGGNIVKIIVSGSGLLNSTYRLMKELNHNRPDLVINAGICGALNKEIRLGQVVQVVSERLGDLGAQTANGGFLDLIELGYENLPTVYNEDGVLSNPTLLSAVTLKAAQGITVNKVHGSEREIELIRQKYPTAEVESMEGAAIFHVCLSERIKFLEIRSISNYVEPRNKANWNIPLAIDNLNEAISAILQSLT